MHFSRYVGHLMGVHPVFWYPADLREAGQLMTLYFAKRAFGAREDGRELIESYPRAFTPNKVWAFASRSATNSLSNAARLHPLLPAGPLLPVL
jgi:hypothetical protein